MLLDACGVVPALFVPRAKPPTGSRLWHCRQGPRRGPLKWGKGATRPPQPCLRAGTRASGGPFLAPL